MLEYHVYTEHNVHYEQAYVFVIDRLEDGRINVKDMYTTIITNNSEIKTRVKLDKLVQTIIETPGGNIDKEDANHIFNIFGDLVPAEIKEQHDLELIQEDFKDNDADTLIRAADAAVAAHESPIDNYGYINANINDSK